MKIPLNPLISEFLRWTLPSLNLGMSTDANRDFSQTKKKKKKKKKKQNGNSINSDETVRLHLHRLFRPQGYKTFFMLNSAEHEIFSANKYESANLSRHFHIY